MIASLMDGCRKQNRNKVVTGREGFWEPPVVGWIKINFYGVASREEDWAAAAGVLRNAEGEWVAGYQRFVGKGSALSAELWVLLLRLQLAHSQGHSKVVVESDCAVALQMIRACAKGESRVALVQEIVLSFKPL